MEWWQLDIVDGIRLADGSETKIVTGVDDHSRSCVIATRGAPSATAACSPACWARRITGTSSAHDTTFESSNDARTTGASWRDLTCEVPSRAAE